MPSHSGRLLVLRLLDEDFLIGCLVDRVEQIATLSADDIRPPASSLDGRLAAFLTGISVVGNRLVAVVDVERLLRAPEIRQFEDKKDPPCEPH
jgi:chemotaxis signal transduction protein